MRNIVMSLRVHQVLKGTFGLDRLRPGQKMAVEALLSGHDLLCVMPTGGGKSLCYQLPALLMDGPALVISPLISLMQDQVAHLREKDIPAALLTGRQGVVEQDDNLRAMREGQARLIYVAPERLANRRFREALTDYPPALVVVDEAHCVVAWGREFRPDYQQIAGFIAQLPRDPLVCAFTATADKIMQQELCKELKLRSPRVIRQPLQRPNLHYDVQLTSFPEDRAIAYARERQGQRGIIFCRTRVDTERMAGLLRQHGVDAECYHAGLSPQVREHTQERFALGKVPVLTATSAFGMGVDIPDIRWVLHLGLCGSPMDYVQQAGRAGRDGQVSECVQLISPRELNWHRRRLQAARDERESEDMTRLLTVFLSGECISRGLTRCFGERSKPCGHCAACLRRKAGHRGALATVPDLTRMKEPQLRYWCLQLTRKRLAAERHIPPHRVMSNERLDRAADTGRLEPGTLDQEAWDRLLAAARL